VFLAAAALASTVAEVARARARDARRRQQEADLAAGIARALLSGENPDAALAAAGRRIAAALEIGQAVIHTAPVTPSAGQAAVSLDLGPSGTGTLIVPADLDEATWDRLTSRVVPPLEALVAAALDRRSDELKTALLRVVSHDLRSPLTAILAAADSVASPTLAPGARAELAGVISDEAARLSHLVDQLLDLSRLQAGAAEPRRDWCSLEEVVTAAAEHVAVPVRVEVDPSLPFIEADAAQLERVFVNLLENAGRFSGGRPIEVHGRAEDGCVAVRVVDHGPGIAAEDLPHVFEPFRRGTANGHAGSGLGLAIVKGLVEANAGRVSVRSQPGAGAEFRVEFPA
jgi:two-component system sensor histidine kinase KdpD